jgi:hypothetical protein
MSETKKRKVHLQEFKAKVGLEALRGVKSINEIGQEYGDADGPLWLSLREHAQRLPVSQRFQCRFKGM